MGLFQTFSVIMIQMVANFVKCTSDIAMNDSPDSLTFMGTHYHQNSTIPSSSLWKNDTRWAMTMGANESTDVSQRTENYFRLPNIQIIGLQKAGTTSVSTITQ